MSVFSITGYFADDEDPIEAALITDYDSTPDGYADEEIFFYGLSEQELKEAVTSGEPVDDFVVTGYLVID